ncbi:MAG: hypothetical protein KAS48_05035 [Gammaproteobacteria bacterium]|nr:hypothetical protein [Gammaproteobacteria bacterium]MCK5091610.1 hypothetical protein [Gammaproteobacteria bacterium]
MSESSSSTIQKIFYVFIAIIIIVPIAALTSYIFQAKDLVNQDLKELTIQRKLAFTQIRPALIDYKKEHGEFPDSLQQLIPDYITSIPEELQSPDDENPIMTIKYRSEGSNAFFHYQTSFGQATTVNYDIGNNTFSNE